MFKANRNIFQNFEAGILAYFKNDPKLNNSEFPAIHSIKSRIKSDKSLKRKLIAKQRNGIILSPENIFQEITDLCGIRILHIHQSQFLEIHNSIQKQLDSGDWILVEEPKAYTWDIDAIAFFKSLGIKPTQKDTLYTSTHFVIRPNNKSPVTAEIQIRTLFEEIWGEIDHFLNYPEQTRKMACKEQLRVLAKFVSTGSRLVDSIFYAAGKSFKV